MDRFLKEKTAAILFPRSCPFCGRLLAPGHFAHGSCAAELPLLTKDRYRLCRVCGKRVEAGAELCDDCRAGQRGFSFGHAAGIYEGGLRKAVLDLKFGRKKENAAVLGMLLWKEGRPYLAEWGIDTLVPVPMHARKRKKRGYDQAVLLAGELSRLSGLPVREDLVIRQRETGALKEMGREARIRSLEGAFVPGPGSPAGLRIALVDDIFTTGATIDTVGRLLRERGAGEVCFLAVCIGTGFMIE